MNRYGGVVVTLALLTVMAEGFPPQQPPSSSDSNSALGATYDEIVVETQLAVRPKAASAGLGLRTGRQRQQQQAKAVFFRPNVTSGSSGTETRRITPPAASTTTTPSDGISFAARVVGVENPLASENAAAKKVRGRRDSIDNPGDLSSGGTYSSYSSSRSSSSSSEASGGGRGKPTRALAAAPSSSGRSSASRTYSKLLPNGKTVSVSETDDFEFSQGPGSKAPTSSRLVSFIVSGH